MRIRPGGPGDIAAVLALGDEAVTWMNARGNTQQWGIGPWTGSQAREAVIGDMAHGGGMRRAAEGAMAGHAARDAATWNRPSSQAANRRDVTTRRR